jgi:hypothetical protein
LVLFLITKRASGVAIKRVKFFVERCAVKLFNLVFAKTACFAEALLVTPKLPSSLLLMLRLAAF